MTPTSAARQPHRPAVPPPVSWCIDEDTRDNIVARRNVLLALWAGQRIGLSGGALTAYAVEVHLACFDASGDGAVVRRITADLRRAGLSADPSDVHARLSAFHREALLQSCATD